MSQPLDPQLAANYLRDLGPLLVERLAQATSEVTGPFEQGRGFGLAEAVSLMWQQAISFGIDPQSLGLPAEDPL